VILKRNLTIPLGPRGVGVRVEALVEIESADDATLTLTRIECGSRIAYSDVPEDVRREELVPFVNDSLQQFSDYERDMAQERLEWVRADRAEDMRKAEGE
jgi:hypothetical protein